MIVLLTGATGFVGSYVTRALLDAGHTVRALVRDPFTDGLGAPLGEHLSAVEGDITDPASLQGAFDGADAAIHLVGIIEENASKGVTFERIHVDGTRNVVEAAQRAGVTRFVHMSANGARHDGVSDYQTTKWRAEELVREAGFRDLAVFRPSTIFGDPGEGRPEFNKELWTSLVRPFPLLPVFGDGQYQLQPVHVTEVAAAFTQALELEGNGHLFIAAGQETVTFDETLDRIARGAGIEPKPKLHQPIWLSRIAVNTAGKAGLLPISPAQFEMLIEGNTGDPSAFYSAFDLDPVPYTAEHLEYLKQY